MQPSRTSRQVSSARRKTRIGGSPPEQRGFIEFYTSPFTSISNLGPFSLDKRFCSLLGPSGWTTGSVQPLGRRRHHHVERMVPPRILPHTPAGTATTLAVMHPKRGAQPYPWPLRHLFAHRCRLVPPAAAGSCLSSVVVIFHQS